MPFLKPDIVLFFVDASSSMLAKELSWYTSTLVVSPIFTSGVSRNLRIEAPSILSRVPGSWSNSDQDSIPILPVSSANLPLTTFSCPEPSLFTMTSFFVERTLATIFTNPSDCEAFSMEIGSSVLSGFACPPSLRTEILDVLLMLIDFLSFHSLTETPSSLTTDPGARF